MVISSLKPILAKHYNEDPMEVQEHFYADNPGAGPADAWTTLPGVAYYFLGNGHIQAAVQIGAGRRGTPLGLLLMNPEQFGPKCRALSFDPETGLAATGLEVEICRIRCRPEAGKVYAQWLFRDGLPAVQADWRTPGLTVSEVFFCPDRRRARLVREVRLRNTSRKPHRGSIRTGLGGRFLSREFAIAPGKEKTFYLEYLIVRRRGEQGVRLNWRLRSAVSAEARTYWKKTTSLVFSDRLPDHFFRSSLFQLQANIAASGKLDGSVWQYNREWTRDLAMAAIGLAVSGQFEMARTLLERLLALFVTPDGDTVDSSERRPAAESELDQNGALLFALETYIFWTHDLTLARRFWKKTAAAADFPLSKIFRHPYSGLLHNRREFWERHAAYGIEEGIELAHQFWVSMGLASASRIALLLNHRPEAERWAGEAKRIKKAMLSDERFALIDRGCLIKRRKMTGEVQEEAHPAPASGLPFGVPLFEAGRHLLNPDTSTVLPLAWEFIPPRCRLAARTLKRIEKLWNQKWRGGGYGRYDVSSEPDSPGPWPFPSLFVARAYFEAGNDAKVWRVLKWLGRAQGAPAGTWLEFYGPRPVPPYPQVGIVPWTWAEMLVFFIHHLAGVRPDWETLRIRPRLLSGLTGFRATVRVGDSRLHLAVKSAGRNRPPGFRVDGRRYPFTEEGLRIPLPQKDIKVTAWLPRPTQTRKSKEK
jgi:hypothetical protein